MERYYVAKRSATMPKNIAKQTSPFSIRFTFEERARLEHDAVGSIIR